MFSKATEYALRAELIGLVYKQCRVICFDNIRFLY